MIVIDATLSSPGNNRHSDPMLVPPSVAHDLTQRFVDVVILALQPRPVRTTARGDLVETEVETEVGPVLPAGD